MGRWPAAGRIQKEPGEHIMIEQLLNDLAYMVACWGCGIFTGLGIGAAMGRDQVNRMWRKELMDDDAR